MSSQKQDIESRVEQAFAAGVDDNGDIVSRDKVGYDNTRPSFREKQKATTLELVKGIENPEVDVVVLNAPTGSGKSLILDCAARATPGWNYITTPLNTLVDQLENDEFISEHIIALKGRNNYNCVHPDDEGTDVDKAICQRDSDFECDVRGKCPYYGRKDAALEHPEVVTNLSYAMAEGMIPDEVEGTFGKRHKLFVDECQGIEDFALDFIQFIVSQRSVPDEVWKNVSIPREPKENDMDYLIEWVETELLDAVDEMIHALDMIGVKDEDEASAYEDLRQYKMRVQNFLSDVTNNEWVASIQTDIRKNRPNEKKIVFEPVFIGRFLDNLLFDRGQTVVLSSATIPGGDWLDEIGLGDKTAKTISVGSTFPVENRPVVCNLDVGKMVSEHSDSEDNRKTNAWPMAKRIMELALHHEGEKGFIHCRSYNIMELLKRQYMNHDEVEIQGEEYNPAKWFRNNVMLQDQYNREESLEEWMENDTQVFFSVAMDEGVDLEGDLCRWQALAKTLYPFMTKRMKRRKEIAEEENRAQDFWNYYNRKAVIQIQQAYGRGVRSPEDECVFYILDSSVVQQQGLIQMNAELFNKWFLEAVQGINVDPRRGV